jgi:hypothetical protein
MKGEPGAGVWHIDVTVSRVQSSNANVLSLMACLSGGSPEGLSLSFLPTCTELDICHPDKQCGTQWGAHHSLKSPDSADANNQIRSSTLTPCGHTARGPGVTDKISSIPKPHQVAHDSRPQGVLLKSRTGWYGTSWGVKSCEICMCKECTTGFCTNA